MFKKETDKFDFISIKIASPDVVRSWSRGEVKKPETINYRTLRPEKDGLFCEKIFGPSRDWECSCGKYKRIKYTGIVCDRCGVEVTLSKVRRERMGHIELCSPCSHIWFFKALPSRMALLLNVGLRSLERVIYYEEYIVIDPGDAPIKKKELLTEEKYRQCCEEYGSRFKAMIGAEAIQELLKEIDFKESVASLKMDLSEQKSEQAKGKTLKRLKIIESFKKSGNRPEWMVIDVVPVIPPDLRPLVPLEGGRFATSDLNDLYRRVINRNNRLKKLIELKAPDIIIRNEKRMLQESVDALFDNGRHGRAVLGPANRPLKSLSDMLKGKQGRFRQNLLGKRVDYSGRSVIVIGPELKLWECGLPKKMALELFEPFIIKKLKEKGFVHTIKSAKRIVEKARLEVWDILDDVIKDHPVLLNRAPTLHRLGIQAFQPVLIEGKAIRIHPLVCTAFNADFDGDQMAVHVPLSMEAQMESRLLMLASNNIFSPANGRPIITPTQDIVLGSYYLTQVKPGGKGGEKLIFSNTSELELAFQDNEINLHEKVKLMMDGKIIETTAGRVIFNRILPKEMPFLNETFEKTNLSNAISDCYKLFGHDVTVKLLDDVKQICFEYATLAGISISVDDLHIPNDKKKVVAASKKEVNSVEDQYRKGIITERERYNKIVDIWTHTTDKISDLLFTELDAFNPVFMMANSGARGSKQQIRQLSGMRGLMAKPSGEIIETPITANFREGLTVLEYFISTHGARKGLADTALKTADSGYLTRRLVDAAQDIIISEKDCGTLNGILISGIIEADEEVVPLKERIVGRVAVDNTVDIITDEAIVESGNEITEESAKKIELAGIEKIRIRSVLTCEAEHGVCAKCYGRDLSTGKLVELGTAVGIIAAQSIGEPGTQLTMRTFHIGGTASRIVEQSFIKSKSKGNVKYHNLKVVKQESGDTVVLNRNGQISINDENGRELEKHTVPSGSAVSLKDGDEIDKNIIFVRWDPYTSPILTEVSGKVRYEDILEEVTMVEEVDEATGLVGRVIIEHRGEYHPQIVIEDDKKEVLAIYPIPSGAHIIPQDGAPAKAGSLIAKTPRQVSKTKDITGGLPRVAELFEARRPKDPAMISEIDGIVEFATSKKGQRRIIVRSSSGMKREYIIPHGKHLNAYKGDRVKTGDQLVDGPVNPQDILKVSGEKRLQEYLVDEVQEVYRLQGVRINDKHIEIIVKQMLRKVRVEDAGDTEFLTGMQVDKLIFQEENQKARKKGGKPASATPLLLGITKASLSTESFISAASFQETTRVLTEAAASGRIDELRGLKENVIMGHLIPAGTGFKGHRGVEMVKEVLELKGEKKEEKKEAPKDEPKSEKTQEKKKKRKKKTKK